MKTKSVSNDKVGRFSGSPAFTHFIARLATVLCSIIGFGWKFVGRGNLDAAWID